jgi:hypothetical protein
LIFSLRNDFKGQEIKTGVMKKLLRK